MFDLFDRPELMPEKLKNFFEKNEDLFEDELSSKDLEFLQKGLEKLGYTFDYGLDLEPYGLRPIGTKLEDLEGF